MMACPSLLAPVHSDLPLLLLRAAKISPSVHPPHVYLSLSVGDGFSAKRAVRLIHFRICPIQAKKAHNCYPCNTTKNWPTNHLRIIAIVRIIEVLIVKLFIVIIRRIIIETVIYILSTMFIRF